MKLNLELFEKYKEAHNKGIPVVLTAPEMAALTGLSIPTLAIWRRDKVGPSSLKFGRFVGYPIDGLITYLQDGSPSVKKPKRN